MAGKSPEIPATTDTSVEVTGVGVSPSTLSIEVGEEYTITATVSPANASNKNVTWSSSDSTVATVTDSGVVEGLAEGTAVVVDTLVSYACLSGSVVVFKRYGIILSLKQFPAFI